MHLIKYEMQHTRASLKSFDPSELLYEHIKLFLAVNIMSEKNMGHNRNKLYLYAAESFFSFINCSEE
jgi:hypothetical protein